VDAHVEGHVHEVPSSMKYVLVVLALLSLTGGLLGLPGIHLLEDWLAPVMPKAAVHGAEGISGGHHVSMALEIGLMAVSVVAAVMGILVGMRYYRRGRGEKADALARSAGGLYRLLHDKYRIDELYDATVLRAYYALCRAFNLVDGYGVDGAVNGAGSAAEVSGNLFRLFHTGVVRNYALFFLLGAAGIVWYLVA